MAIRQWKIRMGYWRKVRRMTQKDLAQAVRVSVQTISNWETGVTAPTPAQAAHVAMVLGKSVRELFPFF
ncbi:MAG: helix-turn-helix protein [Symbiobacteriaceae bacterium]|jgi:transcriptional regulator with XRE-family HTH domain|nr:helix-turn-helix protein [Symbiobacteriaceae bacterium]